MYNMENYEDEPGYNMMVIFIHSPQLWGREILMWQGIISKGKRIRKVLNTLQSKPREMNVVFLK